MKNVTVKVKVFVDRPPAEVWDYTQDYARRTEWDHTVLAAKVEKEDPRVVWVRGAGGVEMRFQYKLNERPHRTSLIALDIKRGFPITGGGGAWTYEPEGNGTTWTNVSTLSVGNRFLYWILRPLIAWQLRRSNERSMKKVKAILEARPPV